MKPMWRGVGVAAVLTMGTAAGWWFYLLPAGMLAALGLHGPLLGSNRECRRDPYDSLVRCVFHDVRHPALHHAQEVVIYRAGTRTVRLLERTWILPDSITWQRAQDSIRTAMWERGARLQLCEDLERQLALDAETSAAQGRPSPYRAVLVWRLPHQDVRLIAYRFPQRNSGLFERHPWLLELNGLPDGTPSCRAPRRGWRLMTFDEMMTAWHRWLGDPVGF